MKRSPLLVVTLAVSALPAALVLADDAGPKAQPAYVYEPMASRSPFMAPSAPPVATPPPVQAAGPHWWDQMVVTSLMETGGIYIAAVVDRANNKRYVLETGRTDEESHLLLAEVQWNDHADQSTVTVRKGAEIAPPLRFDAAAASSSAPTGAPQPFNPQRNPAPVPGMTPPPRFTAATPPPPPVVHHGGPIGSRPTGPGNPASGGMPTPPPVPPQRRAIRPLGGNTVAEN